MNARLVPIPALFSCRRGKLPLGSHCQHSSQTMAWLSHHCRLYIHLWIPPFHTMCKALLFIEVLNAQVQPRFRPSTLIMTSKSKLQIRPKHSLVTITRIIVMAFGYFSLHHDQKSPWMPLKMVLKFWAIIKYNFLNSEIGLSKNKKKNLS